MARYILLFAVTAVLTGCEGDVLKTSPPQEVENNQATKNSTGPRPNQPSQNLSGHESPEAVFTAMQKASAADDLPAALKCMDAESQKMLASMMSLPLALMALDPEKQEGIEELMSKHGISLEEPQSEFPIETEQARIDFIIDVQEWLENNADTFESREKSPFRQMADASLGEVTVEGNSAHATITMTDNQTDEVEFKRIDGRWFLHIGEPKMTSSSEMEPFDSKTFESNGFGAFEEDEPAKPIQAVTMDQYQTAWQITLDVNNQPAGEQLTQLAEELGLKLNVDPQFKAALQKPVSVQVADGSRLQAIEEICRQIELTPRYMPKEIRLESGRRKHPVQFAGPFLFTINKFETEPQTATGQLSVKVYAASLPPALLASLNEGSQILIDLEEITDQKQNNLQRQILFGHGAMRPSAVAYHRDISIDLKNLLRSVETIPNLKGKMSLTLPTRIETIKFEELVSGAKNSAGDVTLELTDISGGSVTFKYSGISHDDIHLYAFDAQGKPLDSFGGGSFGSGDSGQTSQSYQSTPDRIEARVVTQKEALDYSFQFEGIPVPNHDLMPEQLPKLQFEGEAPLAVKFDSITGKPDFREVKLQVNNQSNKEVRFLSLNFRYLDKEGNELEKKSKQHGGGQNPCRRTEGHRGDGVFHAGGDSNRGSHLKEC